MPVNTVPVLHYLRQLTPGSPLDDAELLKRFVAWGDHPAFAELMRRHGPMVWGVCRRVLTNHQAAEDAFQATFLVLLRRAETLTRPERLGNWLHGVAHRTALKARSSAVRQHAEVAEPLAPVDDAWAQRELAGLLDEEIRRLPASYRVPFVLCYLEHKTNHEAARLLGLPRGTLATRLAAARRRLRMRLSRRGLAATVVAWTVWPVPGDLRAAVPQALAREAARTVAAALLGKVVGTRSETLAQGVLQAMTWTRIKFGVVVGVLALVTGLAVVARWGGALGPQRVVSATPEPVTEPAEPVQRQATINFRYLAVSEAIFDRLTREGTLPDRCGGVALLPAAKVRAILDAAQQDRDTNVLSAPKLTILHGEPANVQVGEEHAFVTGVRLDRVGGQPVLLPIEEKITLGLNLTVTATAGTPDANGLRLDIATSLKSLADEEAPVVEIQGTVPAAGDERADVKLRKAIQCPRVNTVAWTGSVVQKPDDVAVVLLSTDLPGSHGTAVGGFPGQGANGGKKHLLLLLEAASLIDDGAASVSAPAVSAVEVLPWPTEAPARP